MEKRMKNKQSKYLARPTILLVQAVFMLMLPFVALGPAFGSNGAKVWLLYGVAALLFLIQLALVICSIVFGWNRMVVFDKMGVAMRIRGGRVHMAWEGLSIKDATAKYGKIQKIMLYDGGNNCIVMESIWGLLPLIEKYCTNDALKDEAKRIILHME